MSTDPGRLYPPNNPTLFRRTGISKARKMDDVDPPRVWWSGWVYAKRADWPAEPGAQRRELMGDA